MSGTVKKLLNSSKWLRVQALLEVDELQDLLDFLGDVNLFRTGSVVLKGEGKISKEFYLSSYEEKIAPLREGKQPESVNLTAVITQDPEALFSTPILSGEKELLRPCLPVIQIQAHLMGYSPLDGKFRPMVLGKESIEWGLQFSYPQICEDPDTREILNVNDQTRFPNTTLFRNLQKWMRKETIPSPFCVDDAVQNVPIRLGKRVIPWVNKHPQLQSFGIEVKV